MGNVSLDTKKRCGSDFLFLFFTLCLHRLLLLFSEADLQYLKAMVGTKQAKGDRRQATGVQIMLLFFVTHTPGLIAF